MPGIVGLITKMPKERAVAELSKMAAALHRESFYRTGTWFDETQGVYVAWSLREEAFAGNLPLKSGTGDVALIFAGEEYSGACVRSQAGSKDHFRNASSADYLVDLYAEGKDFPRNLNGRFQGIVIDHNRGLATLFVDRYGMERLYYHKSNETFYFAAEAKAILAARPELRTISIRSLGEFIASGCVLENRTLFEGLHVLPAASAWTFRDGTLSEQKAYFHPSEWEQVQPLDEQGYYEAVRDAFSKGLRKYFGGKDRIGIALTGGLDTRAILAWWKPPAGTVPCYTFCGPVRECQDVKIARNVAEICGQSHTVLRVDDTFLSKFAKYAERSIFVSDGCVDLSRCPDLYVSELARELAPVKIVGTFGSEVLRHLAMFRPVEPASGVFSPEIMESARLARDTYYHLRQEHPVTFAVFRQFPWYHYGVFAHEQSQLTVRAPYLENDFIRAIYKAPEMTPQKTDVRLKLIREGDPKLWHLCTDRGVGGNTGAVRSFYSRAFQEVTFKAEYSYDYGMPQWLAGLDHAFSGMHLERMFLGRHKVFHFRVWYRDQLAGYVKEMLLDSKTLSRPYLKRERVETLVHAHLNGSRNYTTEIHNLLTVELIHRLFVD